MVLDVDQLLKEGRTIIIEYDLMTDWDGVEARRIR
jgi:hypothetical protein